jgi:hypothetical protein
VKRTALTRRTPLRRTPMRRAVKRNVKLTQARFDVAYRAHGRCEARTEVCTGWGQHAHHVVMRSHGGPDTPENLLWVCAMCHHEIHAYPADSYEHGWLKRIGDL